MVRDENFEISTSPLQTAYSSSELIPEIICYAQLNGNLRIALSSCHPYYSSCFCQRGELEEQPGCLFRNQRILNLNLIDLFFCKNLLLFYSLDYSHPFYAMSYSYCLSNFLSNKHYLTLISLILMAFFLPECHNCCNCIPLLKNTWFRDTFTRKLIHFRIISYRFVSLVAPMGFEPTMSTVKVW